MAQLSVTINFQSWRPFLKGKATLYAVIALLLLTTTRLVGLHFSVVDLFVDEVQYWDWSRHLAFGYFSKPPLLAWTIAGADGICGSAEACIRAPSPLFYLGTAIACYALAFELYDERAAIWAALGIALAPGTVFSSRIISTDVPLLFFWAAALLAFVKSLSGKSSLWSVVLGLSLGLGLLSKYAMIYFFMGGALIFILDDRARWWLRRKDPYIAFGLMFLIVMPNVAWNVTHQFRTLRETAGLIETGRLALKPLAGLDFLAGQVVLAGPITFLYLIYLFARWKGQSREDVWMLAFAAPPLALVTLLAFLHGAYGNWAAPAFISAVMVVSGALARQNRTWWLGINVAIGAIFQVLLLIGDAHAYGVTLAAIGRNEDPYQRSIGYRSLAEASSRMAQQFGALSIAGENHYDVAGFVYYLRSSKLQIYEWPRHATPVNYFEESIPLQATGAEPILLVTPCPIASRLEKYYRQVVPIGEITSDVGAGQLRRHFAFMLRDPYAAPGPQLDCR